MPTWITGQIIKNTHWTDTLFSLSVYAPIKPFIAGQFTKIRLTIQGKYIQRAYSYLNPPHSKYLIFYLTIIPEGKLSPILYKLRTGDTIQLTQQAYGHFTLNNIPYCKNLWMIATGTGISPFLSILAEDNIQLTKFTHFILIYAVRFLKCLSYLNVIYQLQKKYQDKLRTQIVLSQEESLSTLKGHIPTLIKNGSLETKIGLQLHKKNTHVMLCGNPNMINETKIILKKKYNMNDHSNKYPGQITTERYW